MPTPSSGTISMSDINANFGRGNDLNAYRGQIWYQPNSLTFGYFPSTPISFSDFYNKQGSDPATSGTLDYTSPGNYSIVIPLYRNFFRIKLWGGGGGGGTSYNGGAGSQGGDGGAYAEYVLGPGVLAYGSTESFTVGAGGLGAQGSGGSRQQAGGVSQFGGTVGVTGGKGGDGQLYAGKPANTFTQTNPRGGFSLVVAENGGAGGFGFGAGQSVTYSGGGGGGMVNDYGGGAGGSSTYGGAGGNGNDRNFNQPRDGALGGGGGGATDWDGGYPAGTGGNGRIILSWG